MVPDRLNVDKALVLNFGVTYGAANAVAPGQQVKLSATQNDPNVIEVVPCTAPTDVPIGLAQGVLGDPDFVVTNTVQNATPPRSARINVLCYFHVVERAIAGSTGVTQGSWVAQEIASNPSTGLINAPAPNYSGASTTFTPGFALATVNAAEAFPLAVLPRTYVTT